MSSASTLAWEAWEYRDPALAIAAEAVCEELPPPQELAPAPVTFTEEQVGSRLLSARQETENAARGREEALRVAHAETLQRSVRSLQAEREEYFRSVEAEIVQLSLGIARKILQRESAADPAILQVLVRIALERMASRHTVRVRLHPADLAGWRVEAGEQKFTIEADSSLQPGEITLETEMGSAQIGLEAQLKEVEQSFADLLARRPGAR